MDWNIKVVGVGGGGISAVNRMMNSVYLSDRMVSRGAGTFEEMIFAAAGGGLIEFIAVDTDLEALANSHAHVKILLGEKLAKGQGARGDAELAREAAVQDAEKITAALDGAELVFVVACLGGGTGTGAAFVIAGYAAGIQALTVAAVTTPLASEGEDGVTRARAALSELYPTSDTVFVIPSEDLLKMTTTEPPLQSIIDLAEVALGHVVHGVSKTLLPTDPDNWEYKIATAALTGAGAGAVGFGRASGAGAASEAARQAVRWALPGAAPIHYAEAVIVNVVGRGGLTQKEGESVYSVIREAVGPLPKIIFGPTDGPPASNLVELSMLFAGMEPSQDSALRDAGGGRAGRVAGVGQPADFLVVWNPETVDRADYVSLITALGDLVRSEGGIGVERIGQLGVGMPVGEDILV